MLYWSLTLFFLQDRQEMLWSGAKLFPYNKQATLWARNDKMLLCTVMISRHVSHNVKKTFTEHIISEISLWNSRVFKKWTIYEFKALLFWFPSTELWPFCGIFWLFFVNLFISTNRYLVKNTPLKQLAGTRLIKLFLNAFSIYKRRWSLSENKRITCCLFCHS